MIVSVLAPAYAPNAAPKVAARAAVTMYDRDAGNLYDNPYAPEGMGREFIDAPRKPLSEFVGGFGEPLAESAPWDPLGLAKLYKVSANNPDPAWLREAELKHGRIAMLAFLGIIVTSGGTVHFPAPMFEKAAAAGWPTALQTINENGDDGASIFGQMVATCALIEGASSKGRWDLWFGERPGGVVAGDYGFDPLKLLPKDKAAADKMRLKELKNGRLAMLAVMGIFTGYLNTGNANLFGPA